MSFTNSQILKALLDLANEYKKKANKLSAKCFCNYKDDEGYFGRMKYFNKDSNRVIKWQKTWLQIMNAVEVLKEYDSDTLWVGGQDTLRGIALQIARYYKDSAHYPEHYYFDSMVWERIEDGEEF